MHTVSLSRRVRLTAIAAVLVGVASLVPLAAQAQAGRLPADAGGVPMPSLAPIVKRASPAVVNIATRGTVTDRGQRNPLLEDPFFRRFFDVPEQGPRQHQFQSAGSGVVVDAKQGLIITNAHVVENATEITVTTIDGRDYKATVVGSDAASDVAVVKVKDAKLAEIALGDSSKAEVGDFVLAIGNPFGLQHTVTYGIVSALGRSGINPDGYEDFIQTDASINPGNSGGALVNLRGELIGINSAILSRSGGNIGIGFAIPSNMVRSVMDQLVKYGEVKRGILGVNIQTVTPDLADKLGAADLQGAFVQQVVEGSAADKAGIKAGDVITTVNGSAVRSAAELRNRIGLMRIGESVDLGLVRDGKPKHVTAIVQSRAAGGGEETGAAGDLPHALDGADLGDAPGGGVLVRSIEPGSPASQQPLKANDVITAADRHAVTTLKDLKAAVKDQTSVLLTVRRGATTLKLLVH
jgi:serine protease Do/serine protease DegQ